MNTSSKRHEQRKREKERERELEGSLGQDMNTEVNGTKLAK